MSAMALPSFVSRSLQCGNGDFTSFPQKHQQQHQKFLRCRISRFSRSRTYRCLDPDSSAAAAASPEQVLTWSSDSYLVQSENNIIDVLVKQPQHDQTPTSTSSSNNISSGLELHSSEEPSTTTAANTLSGSNMLEQMREIFLFAGPAVGIWLSGPIMSLIDTSVVGTSSSLELAALGPGTVMCDGLSYVFMFLSVATSNLIATSLANKNEAEAADHLARLLFVASACGIVMLVAIELFSVTMLQSFVGPKNSALVPAAASYVNIRALAWPAVLVAMVAQSASLGMQDSWNPLKGLLIASVVNAVGDILLCVVFNYGIAGAAWATALSQYVAGYYMVAALKKKGYDPLRLCVPRMAELVQMIEIAAPVLLTMLSKVLFYTCITYFATSLGAITLGAHQVMIGLYVLFSVCGEPLGQTAQSFMPGLITGQSRNLKQAQALLQSLLLIGAVFGVTLAVSGLAVSFITPQFFTKDSVIIAQMRTIAMPFFCSIVLTPPTLTLEGTLLASRDFRFLGFSMASCFVSGSILMLMFHKLGLGLNSCWWTLVLFQLSRFCLAFTRLNSPRSVLQRV